jgi:para-aminobenzoate synthetase component 1
MDGLGEPIVEEVSVPGSPLAVFEALRQERGAVLLESALQEREAGPPAGGSVEPALHDARLGRYSFVAGAPFLTFSSKGRQIEIIESGRRRVISGNPFRALASLMEQYRVPRAPGRPPLLAGAIGYFGYDLGHFVERLSRTVVDDVQVPDCYLTFHDHAVTIDHVEGRAFLSAAGVSGVEPGARIRWLKERLSRAHESDDPMRVLRLPRLTSNFTREAYLRAVERALEYIAAGDIYQVNLSQRFAAPLPQPPLELYRRLRKVNPAPFAAFIEGPDFAVASASPEHFLRIEGDVVETRPIKGTRPRGATPAEDERLASELAASEKDRAENVMIIDLERNDLGRVCEYGSVHVPELWGVERYSTVFHLVSTVKGRLRAGKTALDCLRACFPGGSITGAPKVRAMEIIDELEPTARGVYTGAIGYLCFSGDMHLNIVIRTFVVKNGVAYFQVGGGIVADSVPEAEYRETLDKALGLVHALAPGRPAREEIAWAE